MTPEQKAQEYANYYDNSMDRVITKDALLAGYNADKSELDKELNYWKERCKAAEELISKDTYTELEYQHWQTLKNQENEK